MPSLFEFWTRGEHRRHHRVVYQWNLEEWAKTIFYPSIVEGMKPNHLITIDQDIPGGTPVFKGTRVPVKTLFQYLADNYTLEA